jgi:hypothetical protein
MITQEQIKEDQQILEEIYKKYDLRVHELSVFQALNDQPLSRKDKLVLMHIEEVLDTLELAITRVRQLPDYETY